MAKGDYSYDTGLGETELAYDLRQIYARIVGEHLGIVADARMKKDYPAWFEALENLYVEINQKLKTKEKTEYTELKNKVVKILNENKSAFHKLSNNAEQISNVINALRDLDMWIKQMMENHNMFGSKRDVEGLI